MVTFKSCIDKSYTFIKEVFSPEGMRDTCEWLESVCVWRKFETGTTLAVAGIAGAALPFLLPVEAAGKLFRTVDAVKEKEGKGKIALCASKFFAKASSATVALSKPLLKIGKVACRRISCLACVLDIGNYTTSAALRVRQMVRINFKSDGFKKIFAAHTALLVMELAIAVLSLLALIAIYNVMIPPLTCVIIGLFPLLLGPASSLIEDQIKPKTA